ncbi:MAG: PIN domain-containing protein [Mariprofundaceae bacterium]|nr:PIN domain-containing protein [Mariprofundaceae bacterium]
MKNIHVVDTNFILRFLLADHAQHYRQACAFMEGVQSGRERAYIPEGVMAECIYVLLKVYKTPYAEIVGQLSALLDYRGIVGEHVPAMKQALHISLASSVSFVDAMVCATARQHGWQTRTFDRKLNQLMANGS